MINNKLVLALFVAFALLTVGATIIVTQETYARTWTCNPGSHLVTDPNGLPRCVPDTNAS
jgi:hypothetical protein